MTEGEAAICEALRAVVEELRLTRQAIESQPRVTGAAMAAALNRTARVASTHARANA